MVQAVERVRQRLLRAAAALEAAGVPYAVAGGNAVAAWVAQVDPAAVRNTADVEILLRRTDLDAAKRALESAGFFHYELSSMHMFMDSPNASARGAVKVSLTDHASTFDDADRAAGYSVLPLEALTEIELTRFKAVNAMNVLDMLQVGLIDATWISKLPPDLATRLQQLIDTPEG